MNLRPQLLSCGTPAGISWPSCSGFGTFKFRAQACRATGRTPVFTGHPSRSGVPLGSWPVVPETPIFPPGCRKEESRCQRPNSSLLATPHFLLGTSVSCVSASMSWSPQVLLLGPLHSCFLLHPLGVPQNKLPCIFHFHRPSSQLIYSCGQPHPKTPFSRAARCLHLRFLAPMSLLSCDFPPCPP